MQVMRHHPENRMEAKAASAEPLLSGLCQHRSNVGNQRQLPLTATFLRPSPSASPFTRFMASTRRRSVSIIMLQQQQQQQQQQQRERPGIWWCKVGWVPNTNKTPALLLHSKTLSSPIAHINPSPAPKLPKPAALSARPAHPSNSERESESPPLSSARKMCSGVMKDMDMRRDSISAASKIFLASRLQRRQRRQRRQAAEQGGWQEGRGGVEEGRHAAVVVGCLCCVPYLPN